MHCPLILLADPDSLTMNAPVGLWIEVTADLREVFEASREQNLIPAATILIDDHRDNPIAVIDSLGFLDLINRVSGA